MVLRLVLCDVGRPGAAGVTAIAVVKGAEPPQTTKASETSGSRGLCGDGRTRTAVQTTHKRAFYTLILPLIVGGKLPEDGPLSAYSLRLGEDSGTLPHASGLNDTPGPGHNRPKVRRDTRLARSLGGPD